MNRPSLNSTDRLIEAIGELRGEVRTGLADVRDRMNRVENVSDEALATARNAGKDAEYALLSLRESFDKKLDQLVAVASKSDGGPDRAKIKRRLTMVGIGVALAPIVPAINFVGLHPKFPQQFISALGYALSGLAKVIPGG